MQDESPLRRFFLMSFNVNRLLDNILQAGDAFAATRSVNASGDEASNTNDKCTNKDHKPYWANKYALV